MSTQIYRLCELYSTPEIKPRKKPLRRARPARHGVFPLCRTALLTNYILRDPSKPLIPGTDVRRIELLHLGRKARGATVKEVTRVIAGLEQWAAKQQKPGRPRKDAAPAAEAAP
jgi:hypothetical protein